MPNSHAKQVCVTVSVLHRGCPYTIAMPFSMYLYVYYSRHGMNYGMHNFIDAAIYL